MKKFVYFGFALLAFLGCTPKSTALVVATDSTWPPMEYIDGAGELTGFDIEMVKEIAAAAGFTVEFKSVAWDGIFAGLANGQYDAVVSSVTITEERKQAMNFSDPYINAGQVLVVPSSSTALTLNDLAGKNVGVQIGTTGAMEAAKYTYLVIKTYDEIGLAFEDLVNGRVDGVVVDTPIASNFALQRAEYKDALKIVGEVLTQEFYGLAVEKENTAALELINKGLAAITANGKLDELKVKWGLK